MPRNKIIEKLNCVFADVFDDDSLNISEQTTANEVEDWDSLTHITLIAEVEDAFDMKFAMKDVLGMKNVGEMIDIIEKQCG